MALQALVALPFENFGWAHGKSFWGELVAHHTFSVGQGRQRESGAIVRMSAKSAAAARKPALPGETSWPQYSENHTSPSCNGRAAPQRLEPKVLEVWATLHMA